MGSIAERRKHVRIRNEIIVRYKFPSSGLAEKIYEGKVVNISQNGIMMVGLIPNPQWIPELLEQRMAMGIDFLLPGEKEPIKTLIRIMWIGIVDKSSHTYRIGMQFQEFSAEDVNKIIKFIIKLGKNYPVAAGPAGKPEIKVVPRWRFLGFLLLFILIGGVLTLVVLNQFHLKESTQSAQSNYSTELTKIQSNYSTELTKIESFYQTMVEQLKGEQNKTAILMAELTKLNNSHESSNEQFLKQFKALETVQETVRKRIMVMMEQISQAQSQVGVDNKELAIRLGQLKDNFVTLNDKLHPVTDELKHGPILLGEEIAEGVYTIRITDAVITSTDWTDNDLGSKAAPPDCNIAVYQNEQEIFKSKVAMDTRHPVWDEKFSLNWQKADKLQVVIYDLDPTESEKILSWANTKDKEFLFKDNRLVSPNGSYLNYEIISISKRKAE